MNPVDDFLAAKVHAVQLIAAQLLLQDPFSRRHLAAGLFLPFDFGRANTLTDDDVFGGHKNLFPNPSLRGEVNVCSLSHSEKRLRVRSPEVFDSVDFLEHALISNISHS